MGRLWRQIERKKKHFLGLLWKGSKLESRVLEGNAMVRKNVLGLLI